MPKTYRSCKKKSERKTQNSGIYPLIIKEAYAPELGASFLGGQVCNSSTGRKRMNLGDLPRLPATGCAASS
jgi:hypothetical protein